MQCVCVCAVCVCERETERERDRYMVCMAKSNPGLFSSAGCQVKELDYHSKELLELVVAIILILVSLLIFTISYVSISRSTFFLIIVKFPDSTVYIEYLYLVLVNDIELKY